MSSNIQQAILSIENLSVNERALLAHCLIVCLDETTTQDVDAKWLELAERRFSDLESGKSKAVSWQDGY